MYLGLLDSPTDAHCAELYSLSATVAQAVRDVLRDNPTRGRIDDVTYGAFRPEDADALREWAASANEQDEPTLLAIADSVTDYPTFRMGPARTFAELREPLYDYD